VLFFVFPFSGKAGYERRQGNPPSFVADEPRTQRLRGGCGITTQLIQVEML